MIIIVNETDMEKIINTFTRKTSLLFITVGMMMAFFFVGCQSRDSKTSEDPVEIGIQENLLVVERHQIYLDWDFSVVADLPISNHLYVDHDSHSLSKTVSSVINQELHSLLDKFSIERSDKEKEAYYNQTMTSSDEPIFDLDEIMN